MTDGDSFVLYDDDDFNLDDTTISNGQFSRLDVDGDNNEPHTRLPDSLRYLSIEDGVYPDGKPKNVYANAYILPEYDWAQNVANFNQTNLQFNLNVEQGNNGNNYIQVINRDRGSASSERDDFWVAYVLLGYQGPELEDFDGIHPVPSPIPSPSPTPANENALQGIGVRQTLSTELGTCDCYNSSVCPTNATTCTLQNGAIVSPKGAMGSIVFQEINQDLTRYFAIAPLSFRRDIEEIRITLPHEIGHQFGLLGDQKRPLFSLMDYSDYPNNIVNSVSIHPEHVNIMRRRIKSPGL